MAADEHKRHRVGNGTYMLVYTGTKKSFMRDVEDDNIAPIIEKAVLQKMHRTTGSPEFRSWQNSMQYM